MSKNWHVKIKNIYKSKFCNKNITNLQKNVIIDYVIYYVITVV